MKNFIFCVVSCSLAYFVNIQDEGFNCLIPPDINFFHWTFSTEDCWSHLSWTTTSYLFGRAVFANQSKSVKLHLNLLFSTLKKLLMQLEDSFQIFYRHVIHYITCYLEGFWQIWYLGELWFWKNVLNSFGCIRRLHG